MFTGVFKPRSRCANVATVHPDAGQPVYRDTFHKKCKFAFSPYRHYPGNAPVLEKARRRLISGSPRSTYGAARQATVHAGIPRCYPGCLR